MWVQAGSVRGSASGGRRPRGPRRAGSAGPADRRGARRRRGRGGARGGGPGRRAGGPVGRRPSVGGSGASRRPCRASGGPWAGSSGSREAAAAGGVTGRGAAAAVAARADRVPRKQRAPERLPRHDDPVSDPRSPRPPCRAPCSRRPAPPIGGPSSPSGACGGSGVGRGGVAGETRQRRYVYLGRSFPRPWVGPLLAGPTGARRSPAPAPSSLEEPRWAAAARLGCASRVETGVDRARGRGRGRAWRLRRGRVRA